MLTIIPSVDTEAFRGARPFEQFILGQIDGVADAWGVFRINDICCRYGASATFFVDVYESVFWGEAPFRDLTCKLLDSGADVQLHTHPEFRGPRRLIKGKMRSGPTVAMELLGGTLGKKDAAINGPMTGLSFEQQVKFLQAGMDMLKHWTGAVPVAHRSGGYSINGDTVKALRAVGIPLDSSMQACHANSHLAWTRNAVAERDGLLEFPVTYQDYVLGLPGIDKIYHRPVKTDLNSCSLSELVNFVDEGVRRGLTLMNLFMHSYSLLRFNRERTRFEPRAEDAKKLDRFLALMQRRDDVRVMSCAQALERYRVAPEEFAGSDNVPQRNALGFIFRHGAQRVKNHPAWQPKAAYGLA